MFCLTFRRIISENVLRSQGHEENNESEASAIRARAATARAFTSGPNSATPALRVREREAHPGPGVEDSVGEGPSRPVRLAFSGLTDNGAALDFMRGGRDLSRLPFNDSLFLD